jgi:hypothetical protein
MSDAVAGAKAIGRAVSDLTKAAPLASVIKDVRGAVKKGSAAGRLKKKKREKQNKLKTDTEPSGRSSEDKVTGSGSDITYYPYVQQALTSPRKAIGGPSGQTKSTGPKQITAPGPTAQETASKKISTAKRGTKNTSTIKVAEPMVDLESTKGGTVYQITDLPRQFKKNGNK